MTSRSLSSSVHDISSRSRRMSRIAVLVCFVMASSVWKSVSSPRDLIAWSRAVAMFMCVSSVCLRAVSSGRSVMAVLRLLALDEKSLQGRKEARQTPSRDISVPMARTSD